MEGAEAEVLEVDLDQAVAEAEEEWEEAEWDLADFASVRTVGIGSRISPGCPV